MRHLISIAMLVAAGCSTSKFAGEWEMRSSTGQPASVLELHRDGQVTSTSEKGKRAASGHWRATGPDSVVVDFSDGVDRTDFPDGMQAAGRLTERGTLILQPVQQGPDGAILPSEWHRR
jgi:hypothetical protein